MYSKRDLTQNEKYIKVRLYEYCKYLYEEEKERKENLRSSVKIHLTCVFFALGAISFKLFSNNGFFNVILYHSTSLLFITFLMFFFSSIISFIISLLFLITVLKVWRYERLSDPQKISLISSFMLDEYELLIFIISDFIDACNKNYKVNEEKSKLLSYASLFIMSGLLFFMFCLCTFSFL